MSKYNYFNGPISTLYPGEVFVFGSNLAGIHGAGAAKQAMLKYGAKYGVAKGPTGDCYAIPTKDNNIQTLSLGHISIYVNVFKEYAKENIRKIFIVTQIGCGLAGYKPSAIAPLFKDSPANCWFDHEWRDYLE